jgi:3-vinyl bacteriochlorophyllide hydratase
MGHQADFKVVLYTAAQRQRRDRSPWTVVQGVLAPLQFIAFALSLALVLHFLATGRGLAAANLSVLLKTAFLYAIMVTGSFWEREVYGKWLFAAPFFWEDAVSMLVIALHSAYLVALFMRWLSAEQLMWLALAAYLTYVINATQFLLKFRAARLGERAAVDGVPWKRAGAHE